VPVLAVKAGFPEVVGEFLARLKAPAAKAAVKVFVVAALDADPGATVAAPLILVFTPAGAGFIDSHVAIFFFVVRISRG